MANVQGGWRTKPRWHSWFGPNPEWQPSSLPMGPHPFPRHICLSWALEAPCTLTSLCFSCWSSDGFAWPISLPFITWTQKSLFKNMSIFLPHGVVKRVRALESDSSQYESQIYHLLAMWPWARQSLFLSFFIWKLSSAQGYHARARVGMKHRTQQIFTSIHSDIMIPFPLSFSFPISYSLRYFWFYNPIVIFDLTIFMGLL